jgi:3'(2'), 5'-bisphosphate nucleotidase
MAEREQMRVKELLLQSVRAALQAGQAIMQIYASGSFSTRLKKDKSPVTEADETANMIIRKALKDTGIPVISEEDRRVRYEIRKTWKELWLVDPLDGTREFLKGNGEFTVNIALINKNLPVTGVVYAPALKCMYFSAEGMGSYRLAVSTPDVYDSAGMDTILSRSVPLPDKVRKGRSITVLVSRSHLNDETRAYIDRVKDSSGNLRVHPLGSALKFCLVAEGTADIYPRFGPTCEWDTAAGHGVAAFAGCQVVQYPSGNSLIYNKEDLINPWFMVERAGRHRSSR